MSGCSTDPVTSRLPFVYRIDIQQGNVISQDAVDRLRPGMSRDQVRFVMGTPLVRDPFHADRWDYVYLYEPGSKGGERKLERLTVFFEGDRLARLSGTVHPDLTAAARPQERQVTVVVPPQEPENLGVLTRLWRWLSFGGSGGEDAVHSHQHGGPPPGGSPPPTGDGPAY